MYVSTWHVRYDFQAAGVQRPCDCGLKKNSIDGCPAGPLDLYVCFATLVLTNFERNQGIEDGNLPTCSRGDCVWLVTVFPSTAATWYWSGRAEIHPKASKNSPPTNAAWCYPLSKPKFGKIEKFITSQSYLPHNRNTWAST